jgi:hypothetical protein
VFRVTRTSSKSVASGERSFESGRIAKSGRNEEPEVRMRAIENAIRKNSKPASGMEVYFFISGRTL